MRSPQCEHDLIQQCRKGVVGIRYCVKKTYPWLINNVWWAPFSNTSFCLPHVLQPLFLESYINISTNDDAEGRVWLVVVDATLSTATTQHGSWRDCHSHGSVGCDVKLIAPLSCLQPEVDCHVKLTTTPNIPYDATFPGTRGVGSYVWLLPSDIENKAGLLCQSY